MPSLSLAYNLRKNQSKNMKSPTSRAKHVLHMNQGGPVMDCEHCNPMESIENDHYPEGAAESDTQAQDEGFGKGPMDNTEMPEDQAEARRKTRVKRALLSNE